MAADLSDSDPSDDDREPDGTDPVHLGYWLFDRARDGDADRLLRWIDAGVPVDLTDRKGNTLIMIAAYHGQARTVAGLLARDADPEIMNERGQTPLAGAVFRSHLDVVRVLVDAGADPDNGSPTARDTATFFDLPDSLAIIEAGPRHR